ncbi:MAG: methyltransferase domain-containing protein [Sulfuricurvum sp.]
MSEDKSRWNEKYRQNPHTNEASEILKKYAHHAKVDQAIDIACGMGRNTHFLAELGFMVDAVDISDEGLKSVKNSATIIKIECDLDKYNLTPNRYDLVVNINFLNRRLNSQIKDALKSGGVLIYETFLLAYGEYNLPTTNLDYLLRKNELLHAFIGLDIIYYEEKDAINSNGEKVKVASLVAKKA